MFLINFYQARLEMTPQTLVDNKGFIVYIITEKIYFITYIIFINFHKHFISHRVQGSFRLFLAKCSHFPCKQFICDIKKY